MEEIELKYYEAYIHNKSGNKYQLHYEYDTKGFKFEGKWHNDITFVKYSPYKTWECVETGEVRTEVDWKTDYMCTKESFLERFTELPKEDDVKEEVVTND